MKKKNIVILEKSPILVEGLKAIINGDSDFKLSRTLSTVGSLISAYISEVDIILVNPNLVCEEHLQKTIHEWKEANEGVAVAALQSTYLPASVTNLFDTTVEINDEPTTVLSKLRNLSSEEATQNAENCELSSREKDVLVLVAKGLTNKEIAEKLNISIHTVIAHRKNITKKTNIKSISGLTIYAMLNNLISQNEIR